MADLTAQNKWEPLATDNSDREKIWSKSRTFAGDVWFRFRRKPTAIAGFVIIIALMLFALVGPLFTPYDYSVQNLEVVNVPPVMKVYQMTSTLRCAAAAPLAWLASLAAAKAAAHAPSSAFMSLRRARSSSTGRISPTSSPARCSRCAATCR